MSSENVQLMSNDGEIFTISREEAKLSTMINEMLENCNENDDEPTTIPLISSNILKKVVEWMNYQDLSSAKQNEKDERPTVNITEKDKIFLNMDMCFMLEVLKASNFLQIDGLFNLICKNIADILKTESVENLCKIFQYKGDLKQHLRESAKNDDEAADNENESADN